MADTYRFSEPEHAMMERQAKAEGISVRELIRRASRAYPPPPPIRNPQQGGQE